jgi:hypothetical protein
MPVETADRLYLPPPFTEVRVTGQGAFDEAVRRAPADGAGTLVWRLEGAMLDMAVVLEPEQPLAEARMAFFAGMAAIGDALSAHCPPERVVRFGYPDVLLYDAARLGGARFTVSPDTTADAVPDWMVFGVELIAHRDHLPAPGEFPDSTSLAEEAFDAASSIVESFASYLMLHFDRWAHQGLRAVTDRYMERIDPPMLAGARLIDPAGDLVERTQSGAERRLPLAEGLAACRWRGEGGPKL